MAKKAIACIDIGRTKSLIAIATPDGSFIEICNLPTRVQLGPFGILDEILGKLEGMLQAARTTPFVIAVGCPGPLDLENGLVTSPPNLPDWIEIPIVKLIQDRFGVPVVLDNDANGAAFGEYKFGSGRGKENLVYLTVSTGIGAGVIINGALIRGIRGVAGEIGHTTVSPGGPLCGCGARGCLNAVSSGYAIAENARNRLAKGEASVLSSMVHDFSEITAQTVAEAVIRNDSVARQVWDEAIYFLAIGIGNVAVTLAPQAIIIGGGVSRSEHIFFQPLRALLIERTKIFPIQYIEVIGAALGANSVIYGTLAAVLHKIESGELRL